ncbi:MAG: hypothetical protein IPK52_22585 [Chloroflexi bacterium]|nr:hypothetical protein [Chloroflexota bacterium]
MKRTLTFLLLAILALGAMPAQAVEPADGVFGTARYVPSNAKGFLALRTDDEFLGSLEAVLTRAQALLSDLGMPDSETKNIRQVLAETLGAPSVGDIEAVLAWSGDTITVAFDRRTGQDVAEMMYVIPLVDRATAEQYVTSNFGSNISLLGTFGRFTVYESTTQRNFLLFADDVMMNLVNITADQMSVIAAGNYPLLSGEPAFTSAVSALPSESYSVGLWASGEAFAGTEAAPILGELTLAAGATQLDGSTYAIDVAAIPLTPMLPPLTINPDFAAHIPETMSAVIHGADLAALVNTALNLAEQSTGEPTRATLAGGFALAGLDFSEFLSWIKGDFALVGRLDARSILPSLLGTPANFRGLPGAFDAALLIEAVNPARAQAFAATLSAIFRSSAAQGAEGLAVSDETINGIALTVVTAESTLPNNVTLSLEFALGASDQVFALGTAGAVRAVFSGGASVMQNEVYSGAAGSWLPDPTTVWTLDGLTAANLGTFAYLTLTPVTADEPLPKAEQVSAVMNRFAAFVRHATLSTSVSDAGAMLLRATITLGE